MPRMQDAAADKMTVPQSLKNRGSLAFCPSLANLNNVNNQQMTTIRLYVTPIGLY